MTGAPSTGTAIPVSYGRICRAAPTPYAPPRRTAPRGRSSPPTSPRNHRGLARRRARPRADRGVLVDRDLVRAHRTGAGLRTSPTSPPSPPSPASSRSSRTPTPAVSSAGPPPRRKKPNSAWTQWRWRCGSATGKVARTCQASWSTTATQAVSPVHIVQACRASGRGRHCHLHRLGRRHVRQRTDGVDDRAVQNGAFQSRADACSAGRRAVTGTHLVPIPLTEGSVRSR